MNKQCRQKFAMKEIDGSVGILDQFLCSQIESNKRQIFI